MENAVNARIDPTPADTHLPKVADHVIRTRRAGHDVVVSDVAKDLEVRWLAEHRGVAATDLAAAVNGADFVVTSLPADAQLLAVADAIVDSLDPSAVWIDHSTTSAGAAREVAMRHQVSRSAGSNPSPTTPGAASARLLPGAVSQIHRRLSQLPAAPLPHRLAIPS